MIYEGTRGPQLDLQFNVGEIERALFAKVVKKCGNRHHWEDWANDIAKIANTHITRIKIIVTNPKNTLEMGAFKAFADELRDDLNDAISDDEIIEMLAQHMVTRPVFEALFDQYSFAENNPVSQGMQRILDLLDSHRLDKKTTTLQHFYESVRMRAEGIDSAEGKQRIVVELYGKFFRNAFPRLTKRLGIVYTPVEVVDFIIHSVDHLLKENFNLTLGSKGVHILDPFTGTGTFISRLLQSGLIKPEELPHKYKNEIHANEIVLLAYYIAAINIEAVYHSLAGDKYIPFEGICLTDTFQLYEKDDLISNIFVDNSDRRKRQKALDIRVILGNPPYSIGQGNANDNNANVQYPNLDGRIAHSYAEKSVMTSVKGLYDSYIRAIRWASDRVGDCGIVGFVTNAGFIESNSADGMRKCLAEEFSDIYIFHLRGNLRTQGEMSRKEGGQIFGSGSRAPIAISLLVKNTNANAQGKIHYHDIGDYLTREDKLKKIEQFKNVAGISNANAWQPITPDKHGDWINQRDDSFYEHLVLGDKKGTETTVFETYTLGVATGRDCWCYGFSMNVVAQNMNNMISFYNEELAKFDRIVGNADRQKREKEVGNIINTDPKCISWNRNFTQDIGRHTQHQFNNKQIQTSIYRPFVKEYLCFGREMNAMVYQLPKIFPNADAENLVICVNGRGAKDFSSYISNCIVDLNALEAGSQCFPLYLYEDGAAAVKTEPLLDLGKKETSSKRRDGITDVGLAHFASYYPSEKITKEDLFYYIYGILHSTDYRTRYADNLSKELPRIPRVKKAKDFWAFSKAGRDLAHWHLNYETVDCYPATIEGDDPKKDPIELYRVVKMKHPKKKVEVNGKKKNLEDKTQLQYNNFIKVTNIPEDAYKYIVNGKPALKWVMERQCIKTDKKSGIVNDANLWATETMNNPRYPLELFLRVITVSLETMKIVNGLPGSADRIVHCTRWDGWDAADRQIATSDLDAKSGAKRGVKSDNQEGLF